MRTGPALRNGDIDGGGQRWSRARRLVRRRLEKGSDIVVELEGVGVLRVLLMLFLLLEHSVPLALEACLGRLPRVLSHICGWRRRAARDYPTAAGRASSWGPNRRASSLSF